MPVGAAAALIFLFYLSAVPVELALEIRTSPALIFGAGASLFEWRFALRHAQKRINEEKKRLPWKKFMLEAEKIRALRAMKYILRRLKLEKLTLSGSIAAGDAASTALVCGGLGTIGAAAEAVLPGRVEISLRPDFSGGKSTVQFSGIISLRAGHIILAALIGAAELAKGRISQWKSTRLKIS